MRESFVEFNFRDASLEVIEKANSIIREYQAQGFTLTLRQLYYQFVARGIIPNKQTEYKRLGSIINDGRLAGLIDWESIEDRTRNLESPNAWDSPEAIVRAVANQYDIDRWANQTYRIEVWVEKEALVGVIEPICEELHLPYFACRGYGSQSELWRAGKRFYKYLHGRSRQRVVVLHLGDHDPSGIDMTRDNANRLRMFARGPIDLRRLALNMNQVEQYNPPPNPAKLTDSRATGYIAEHGDESWELDALEPTVIAQLIRDEVDDLIDQEEWDRDAEKVSQERAVLTAIADRWEDVAAQYGGGEE